MVTSIWINSAIDFIRDQHLHMLEMLDELEECALNDTIQMVADLDELENKLKDSWQNKQFPCVAKRKTVLLRATTKYKRV